MVRLHTVNEVPGSVPDTVSVLKLLAAGIL